MCSMILLTMCGICLLLPGEEVEVAAAVTLGDELGDGCWRDILRVLGEEDSSRESNSTPNVGT